MKKQSGFTLIEIVMVLVLLGILTAVAVPKYFDLQKDAARNVAYTLAAEYQSRLNAYFAKELLAGNSCTAARGTAQTKVAGDTDLVKTTATDADKTCITKVAVDSTDANLLNLTIKVNGEEQSGTYTAKLPSCSAN